MGKGINIEFVSDVRKFLGGTRDVEKALDDVSDSLDDLTRDATKAGEKVGDELKDGAEKAEDAGKKLERKFRDALDTVKDDSRKAGDDLGDNIKRGADKASDGMDTLKDEARDTARETAASFDGTADSLVDMVQETAANALGGFGPIGAAAGLAIAAGAGVAYQAWQEKTELMKGLVSSMYEDMLESGQAFASEAFVNDQITKIMTDSEDAVVSYKVAQEQAARAGVDLALVLRAYAGDQEAANTVAEAARTRLAELGDGAGSTSVTLQGLIQGVTGVGSAATTAAERVGVGRRAMLTTGEAARDYANALGGIAEATTEAQDRIRANNETLTDAEERATANKDALADYAGELQNVSDTAAAAGVTGGDLVAIQTAQYDAFLKAAEGAGIAREDARRLAEQYGLIPRNIATKLAADTYDAQITVDRFIRDNTGRLIRVKVDAVTGLTTSGAGIQNTQQARASGGPVTQGRDYVVGEHGPEIFRAPTSGTITPNAALTRPGPLDLSDASLRRLADLITTAAQGVSARQISDYARAVHAAGRAGIR